MHLNLSIPRALRGAFTALALLSALFAGLMPSGWMPHAAEDGAITLTICTGEGTTELSFDADGNLIEGEPREASAPGMTCPFAGFAATGLLPETFHLAGVTPSQHPVLATPAFQVSRISVALPGQRAPPAHPEFMTQIA